MGVLLLMVEKTAAVVVDAAQGKPHGAGQITHDLITHLAQISREDQIVIVGLPPEILQETGQGLGRGGSHGRAHVAGIGDPHVAHAPHPEPGDGRVRFAVGRRPGGKQNGSAAGDGVLGAGLTLLAVHQRGAVFPFGGGKVGGGDHPRSPAESPIQKGGGEDQSLSEGGTGAVKTAVRHVVGQKALGGGHALPFQIAREKEIGFGGGKGAFLVKTRHGPSGQTPLRLLPGLFTEIRIVEGQIEGAAKPAFLLKRSRRRGCGFDPDGRGKLEASLPALFEGG